MNEYPPKVLLRSRTVAQATAGSLPVSVAAASLATITIAFIGALASVAASSHTRVRVSLLGSTLTTDTAGQPFITLQSANLQAASGNVSQPLNIGSSLGALDGAVLNGVLEFDTDDLLALGIAAPTQCSIVLVAKNSDSGAHNVTGATATVLIEATQYADAMRETV